MTAFDEETSAPGIRRMKVLGAWYDIDHGSLREHMIDRISQTGQSHRAAVETVAGKVGISRQTLWEFMRDGSFGTRALFAILAYLEINFSEVARPVAPLRVPGPGPAEQLT